MMRTPQLLSRAGCSALSSQILSNESPSVDFFLFDQYLAIGLRGFERTMQSILASAAELAAERAAAHEEIFRYNVQLITRGRAGAPSHRLSCVLSLNREQLSLYIQDQQRQLTVSVSGASRLQWSVFDDNRLSLQWREGVDDLHVITSVVQFPLCTEIEDVVTRLTALRPLGAYGASADGVVAPAVAASAAAATVQSSQASSASNCSDPCHYSPGASNYDSKRQTGVLLNLWWLLSFSPLSQLCP
jgi:hypothetical protein